MQTTGTILVFDLGTTNFKLTLFDRDGRLRETTRRSLSTADRTDGTAVLDTDDFERLVTTGVHELQLRDPAGFGEIQAVTFASQANSFVLLDDEDRPLTPLILWSDRRGVEFLARARELFAASPERHSTGVPAIGYEFMLTKLLWLGRHTPEVRARTSRLCLISDYLTLLLTGKHVTEAGVAALTGLEHIERCEWLSGLAAAFDVSPNWLGTIVRAGTCLGAISPAAAAHWSLPPRCTFVVGCLDQYAGAIGAGNLEPGRVSETTGTVLATVRCVSRPVAEAPAGVFQGPGFSPNLYFQMIFGDTSAALLERLHQQHRLAFDDLVDEAARVPPGADGLRLKHDATNATLEERFDGLAVRHTSAHRTRCILEAVAVALREQVRTLCGVHLPNEIRSLGGAARSRLWLQIKADVLGVGVCPMDCPEPTSLGAAILAEAALQEIDPRQVAASWVRPGRALTPDPGVHEAYRRLAF